MPIFELKEAEEAETSPRVEIGKPVRLRWMVPPGPGVRAQLEREGGRSLGYAVGGVGSVCWRFGLEGGGKGRTREDAKDSGCSCLSHGGGTVCPLLDSCAFQRRCLVES